MEKLLDQARAGGKLVSPTSPLTQGGNFISMREITRPNGKTINKLTIITLDNGNEIISDVRMWDIRKSNDWSIL